MRIHIFGIYGSGKSSLAKELSLKLKIHFYSLDDIKYLKKYSKIRSVNARIKRVRQICKKKNWITEGTWSNYAVDCFRKADLVIFLDTPKSVYIYRILLRYLSRDKCENDTLFGAFNLIRKVFSYHRNKDPVSFYAHKILVERYGKKLIILRNKQEIKGFLERDYVSPKK